MKNITSRFSKINTPYLSAVIFSCFILASILIISIPASMNAVDSVLNVSCHASPVSVTTGQTVNFVSSVSGGTGSYNYQWSGNCSGTSATCSNSFASTGVYTANLTVTSGSQTRSASCPVSVTATVTPPPPPPPPAQATLNVSCSASPVSVSTNQSVNFVSSVSGGNGTYNYQWSGNCSGTSANCANSFATAGTRTANLTVTSGTQTDSATCPVSVTATVTPPPPPPAQATLNAYCSASPVSVTTGQTVNFVSSVSGGNGTYNYQWSGNCSGTSANCSNSFATAGTRIANLTVISGSQSRSATCPVSVTATVTPPPPPPPPPTQATLNVSCYASPVSVDTNQTVNFNSTVSGGTGSYIYTWSGNCSGTSANCSNSFATAGTRIANLTVTSGTQSRSASCPVSVTATVTPPPPPPPPPPATLNVSCYASPVSVDTNQTVNFNSTVSGGTGSYNYQWSGACTGSSTNCAKAFTGAGVYTANLRVTSGSQSRSATCPVNVTAVNIICSSNPDCGTNRIIGNPFCQGGDVYKNFISYTCHNPGTASSFCTNSTAAQLQTNCTANQICSNGACTDQTINCSTNSQCGTNGVVGLPFCQNNNVYQNYKTYTCNNAGTPNSYCSDSTASQLKTDCTANQICSTGSCTTTNTCTPNYQQKCSGSNLYWYDSCGNQQGLSQYCANGCSNNSCQNNYNYLTVQTNSATNIYNNQATLNGYLSNSNNYSCNIYSWFQWGTTSSYGYETPHQQQNNSGSFSQNISNVNSGNTYHFRAVAQGCSGNTVYGQDMIIYSNTSNNSSLTVSKTVRNLTSGSGWSSSTYANPSDTLMFMITLQTTGNQSIQNVFVRDTLPADLIYNNQLVVACSGNNGSNNCNNSNYNYSGNIVSGINLNTIYAGQTVTITYQTQVAPVQNFAYGTTTLNNNVSVTSSQSGYTPTSNASVIVSRSAILGASTVSTGLTNNFWVDSFFLPLLITLILIWMWKSGMFIGIEKWMTNKRKISRTYKAEKELSARIANIQKFGSR